MTTEEDVAFCDLKPELFPFSIEWIDEDGATLHRIDVAGPGSLRVPSFRDLGLPRPVPIVIRWGDGEVQYSYP
jgi:hypothetical protein